MRVVCMQCERPESQCECDRYCVICKGGYGIRLCEDGMYYCPDCREACDVKVVENRD